MGNLHAKLSPSKADRWMNCPGSLHLEDKCPEQGANKYAAEGTAAHEVAGKCLSLGQNASEWINEVIEVGEFKFKVDEAMAGFIQEYLDTVRGDLVDDGMQTKALMVEKKFQIPSIKGVWGTSDAAYTSPFGRLKVYDLKYGQGTFVEVEDNPQLLIYALGVWYLTGKTAEEIEVVIVQPRYPGEEHVRRAVYTKAQLLGFESCVIGMVARIDSGDKTLQTGTWCKFCPALSICDAKTREVFAVVPKNSDPLPEPASLTIDQIVKVLKVSEAISDWAAAVHAHAEGLAQSGVPIPGYKLVQKRGNRRWIDEIAVETAFETLYGEEIYTKKLKSPAQLEKLVGKDEVKEYVEIPDNGTQLVPESAKGEAISAKPSQVFEKLK